jgi:hypothetical protein
VQAAMDRIERQAGEMHARLAEQSAAQVDALGRRFDTTVAAAVSGWQSAHEAQGRLADERAQAWTRELHTLAGTIAGEWQQVAQRSDARQAQQAEQVARVLAEGEALLQARQAAERAWMAEHQARLEAWGSEWRSQLEAAREDQSLQGQAAIARLGALQAAVAQQLDALREAEAQRGAAATDRLGALEAAVAGHLAALGASLEAPLARLLQTASEVPEAAAGVLVQLRREMAQLAQQENAALAERTALAGRLEAVVQAVETAAREAGATAARVGAGAVELAAWGDAFGHGVEQFHTTSEQLVTALQKVEAAVTRSTARSDEQVAYYVAQAREVIDLSIASQHGVIERLRELGGRPAAMAKVAANT